MNNQEDDVVIADEYVIRSTTQISDAYKSGDTSALSDKEKETLDMASSVLSEIIEDGMTDYEKEKAVYDWMTTELSNDSGLLSVIPTTQADCDNPYGVLKYHNAVCVGYATTFRLFMEMMDIPCMVVHNTDLYHSWDLVQLDGNWYHTDIYSDVDTSAAYAHFNMTDDMMSGTGQDWNQSYFPAATSLQYNIIYSDAKVVEDVYTLPEQLRESFDQDEHTMGFLFKNDSSETEDISIAESIMNRISDILMTADGYEMSYLSWSWSSVDDGYMLSVILEEYSNWTDDSDLSDEVLEKISDAVSDSFSDLADDDYDFDDWEDEDWQYEYEDGAVG
jgi:hypothetical protein